MTFYVLTGITYKHLYKQYVIFTHSEKAEMKALFLTNCLIAENNPTSSIHPAKQKYSRPRCLLLVKGLVICFYLGWSGSTLPIRTNIIKVGSNSWLLICSSNITLSLPSYIGSDWQRELNFHNGYLSQSAVSLLPNKISKN